MSRLIQTTSSTNKQGLKEELTRYTQSRARKRLSLFGAEKSDVTQLNFSFPLRLSYDYATFAPNEEIFEDVIYWSDTYKKHRPLNSWNHVQLDDVHSFYLDSLKNDPHLPLTQFFVYKYPTLVSFFVSQMVDIPHSFKRAKSLYSASTLAPQARFTTMLMRHGRRAYISKVYSLAFSHITYRFQSKVSKSEVLRTWKFYYAMFTQLKVLKSTSHAKPFYYSNRSGKASITTTFKQVKSNKFYEVLSGDWVQYSFYRELLEYLPVFGFSVRKVDKLRRRHSRDRSSKHFIIWKYIPKYRRFLMVLRWLVQDVRFRKSKTFQERLTRSLESLFFDKSDNLVYKLRRFAHEYVFQTKKKTLLATLKATT